MIFVMIFKCQIILNNHTIIRINFLAISMNETIIWVQVLLKITFGFLDKLMGLFFLFFLFFLLLLSCLFFINACVETIAWFCLLLSQGEVSYLFLGLLFFRLFGLKIWAFAIFRVVIIEFHDVIQSLIFMLMSLFVKFFGFISFFCLIKSIKHTANTTLFSWLSLHWIFLLLLFLLLR